MPAPVKTISFAYYAIALGRVIGYHGGSPPEGSEWWCAVGDANWRPVVAGPRLAARTVVPAVEASMFDDGEDAA